MKKLLVLLGILCALCMVSCGNIQLAGGDMGVVSLTIGDELAREIRSAASLRNVADGTYTLTASIRGGYSDSQTVAVADDPYSGVTFTFEGVPVGETIVLDLTAKANGNYIWYGNSGKHTVEQGENLLTIALGRVSGVLMWDSSSVKIARYGNLSKGSDILNPKTPPVWCFDAQGNLYVMDKGNAGTQYALNDDGTYPTSITSNYSNSSDFSFLSYDNATGILYGIEDSADGLKLRASPAPGQAFSDSSWKPVLNSFKGQLGMVVHDDHIYTAGFEQQEKTSLDGDSVTWVSTVTISKYNVNKVSDDGNGTEPDSQENFILKSIFGTTHDAPSPSGQMIYHEGSLYLLLRSHGLIGWGAGYSIGAVVKINAQTLKVEKDFGQEGYLGLVPSSRQFYGISCYAPTDSNDNAYFYGPMGFVAIMPKKLVIADSGYAMSAGNALVNLSKRRRIVTVDLETESFSSVYDIDGNFYDPSFLAASGFENVN